MYFFAQLSNYSVRCGAEFPADICSISFKALYFQVISDGRQYNFHLPRNLLPEPFLERNRHRAHSLPLLLSLIINILWCSSPDPPLTPLLRPGAPGCTSSFTPPSGQDLPGLFLWGHEIYIYQAENAISFQVTLLRKLKTWLCRNVQMSGCTNKKYSGESVLMFESIEKHLKGWAFSFLSCIPQYNSWRKFGLGSRPWRGNFSSNCLELPTA